MSGQGVRNDARAGIPESHCAVKVRRGDLVAGRIIVKLDRGAVDAGQWAKRLICAAIPHLNWPSPGARYKLLAVRAERNGHNRLVMRQIGHDIRGQQRTSQGILRGGGLRL